MEYFLGSVVTLICVFLIILFIRKPLREPTPTVRYSQSHVHDLIEPFIPNLSEIRRDIVCQSTRHYETTLTRVAFVGDKAYWIANNKFVVADIVDGEVDRETERQVDTMSMSKIELNKMLVIIEELTEGGKYDNGSSRNQGL
jgi:hypothetical protein